jgi:hypothetical protein
MDGSRTRGTAVAHDDGTRRAARAQLAVATVVVAIAVLIASPLRLFALLGDPRADERGTASVLDRTTGASTASVTPDVTAAVDDGPEVRGAPMVTGGDVTQGRWGAAPDRPTGPELLLEEFRGGWRVEGGNEEAAALAVIAAHAWADVRRRPSGTSTVSGDGSATGVTGVIVAIEAVERPGAHHAVVTALVAPDGAAGQLHRIAVPLTMGPLGPSLAGEPWSLPGPVSQALLPVAGIPIADAELIASARRALDAVGLPGDRLVALEATDGWPFIARLDDASEAHPWLRWHLDRFVIAGLPLARTGGARP